jgi:agmatinase
MSGKLRVSDNKTTTFLRAPRCTLEEIPKPETAVAVLGVPYDNSLIPGNTSLAPDAIREGSDFLVSRMALSPGWEVMDLWSGKRVKPLAEPRIFDLGNLIVHRTDMDHNNQVIREALRSITASGAFPVVLGGDHYVTAPCFWGASEGLAGGNPGYKMGYIHVDAHTDLFDDWPGSGKYTLGTTARRISELDVIDVPNMVWLGLRGWARPAEGLDYAIARGANILSMNIVREKGVKVAAQEAMELASRGVDAVYVSFDIDVVDSSYVPGISVPEPGGITSQELIDIVNIFRESALVRAIDLVEVCPDKESGPFGGLSAQLAALALIQFIAPRVFDYR